MLDLVKKFFSDDGDAAAKAEGAHHDVTVAACALFVEMATIDGEFDDTEIDHILEMLERQYGVSGRTAQELMLAAKAELDSGIDMWRYTNLINQNYSAAEKFDIVKLLWQLVYADGHLSEHENYLMRKMGKMLKLSHKDLIDAKLTVLKDRPQE